eukprot:7383601-Prymnesium_polylepis.1
MRARDDRRQSASEGSGLSATAQPLTLRSRHRAATRRPRSPRLQRTVAAQCEGSTATIRRNLNEMGVCVASSVPSSNGAGRSHAIHVDRHERRAREYADATEPERTQDRAARGSMQEGLRTCRSKSQERERKTTSEPRYSCPWRPRPARCACSSR